MDLASHAGCSRPVQLRPYQLEAVKQIRSRIQAGIRRVVVVAPTGSGKTTIASYLISRAVGNGARVLFMAHRRELIGQAYNRLVQLGVPEVQVGVMMGADPRRRPGVPVQVASVDTLRHRAKPLADVLFVDECHRALAKTYRDIAKHYPAAIHLGLTATPFRANGDGLGDVYDDLVVVASPQQLIDQGYLVEPRVFTVPRRAMPDLSAVRTRRGDYEQRGLAAAVNTKALVGNMVKHWMQHARGLRTVAFAVSVAHSRHITGQFRKAGVAAEHLDGTMALAERDAVLKRLDAGATTVVSCAMVLAEGWDQPSVKCAILARPTKSTGLYLQQAGRILRPWGGEQAIILDHSGCALEHGLPQDDRAFTLEGTSKASGRSPSAPVRTCPGCFAVLPPGTLGCPECGESLGHRREVPVEREGTLVEMVPEEIKRREFERLRSTAEERGYGPDWVYRCYGEMFGEEPPRAPLHRELSRVDRSILRDKLRGAARAGKAIGWASLEAVLRAPRTPP